MNRRLELNAGASPMFWQISQKGKGYTTQQGRIGAKGKTVTKQFATPANAKAAAERAVGLIMQQGYVETVASVEANEPHHWGTSLSTLIQQLKDKELDERVEAARQIHSLGPRAAAAVPALTKALSDKSDLLRSWAAATLAQIGPSAKAAAKELLKASSDDDRRTRINAAEALWAIGQRKRATSVLVACLEQPETKEIAGDAIVTMDRDAHAVFTPLLRARAKSKDKKDAAFAARVLSAMSKFEAWRREQEQTRSGVSKKVAAADDASAIPSPAELRDLLQSWFDEHVRSAWKPKVRRGDGKSTDSKFGGQPWLSPTETWPACQQCERPLELFLQLNLAELPPPMAKSIGQGLLQLFYCRHNCGDGGFEYFNESMSHVRIAKPKGAGQPSPKRHEAGTFPAKRIVGWQPFDDLPTWNEQEELGLRRKFDSSASTFSVVCESPPLAIANLPVADEHGYEEIFHRGILGDKLGGWPCWIQSPSYPHCPQCDARMQFVFQVDSRDNLPFMFGDSGCGYLFQCKKHKSVVAFGWDCH